jgi:heptosyltransferase-3
MGPKAAVFCHNGLGDGAVSLVLSNNLYINGWKVDTYNNAIGSMQSWIPHLPVLPYPSIQKINHILHQYEWFFVFQDDSSEFIHKLITEGKRHCPAQMKVIYAYPSHRIIHEPYYQDSQINPDICLVDGLRLFCEQILHLPELTRSNGFIPLPGLQHRLYQKRVLIHPTSSRVGKNWNKEKFIALAHYLHKQGYQTAWIIGPQERAEWECLDSYGFEIPRLLDIAAVAAYIYESGYLIGNDSGMGHLASFLEIPTLTITRRKTQANLWAPGYGPGIVVTPCSWIPNISGFRLRDQYWKKFLSVNRVRRAFRRLARNTEFPL